MMHTVIQGDLQNVTPLDSASPTALTAVMVATYSLSVDRSVVGATVRTSGPPVEEGVKGPSDCALLPSTTMME